MYSYWQRYSLSCGFTGRSSFKTFLFVKFVDLLEKNCVSYSELSVPFRYDEKFSSNVKSSPQWSAWLSGISQRLEWTIGILNFFSVFIKQGNQNREGKIAAIHILQVGDRRHVTSKIFFLHEDRFHSRLHPQFTCMTFIYSQLSTHYFTGLFGTNIMNISQLAWLLSW